ncbi:MAG: HD domain-containing phosphohydrolase [Pseudomonadota bacterium]
MKIRKISQSDLYIGQLLPWDVYGEGGGLLARKGHLIANHNQLDSLVERGVYEDASEEVARAQPVPSVLRILNGATLELQTVLHQIASGTAPADVRRQLEEIARLVTQATALNADVALACILHNQRAGPYSVRHSIDTAVVAQLVALALKKPVPDIDSMTLAALTMNVGMLAEHDRLQDSRRVLTDGERSLVHAHPQAAVELLRQAGIDEPNWLACVLAHHENEDGSGYPGGVSGGTGVPDTAKLIALADRYCARVTERQYRPSMLPNGALRDILLEAKNTLDGLPAAVLIRELGIYPVGTYVRLLNGEVGVVWRKGLNPTTPWVTSLVGPRGAPLDPLLQRDTRGDLNGIREVLSAAQANALFRMEQVWGRAASP